ncbi:MAG: response regulator [bacterium]|nr:response regulator [bacterium]
MYQVLVVDDESVIRESISTRIPWTNMGYQLAGTCENGRQAVEILQREKIDVVLTDISMPYMDGLELAEYIHEHCPKTKTIIISCYDEFDYARRAMHYQVFSYIIKPITAKEMIETLNHIKKTLDAENREERELSAMKSELQENRTIQRNRFLMDLLTGRMNEEECQQGALTFQLADNLRYYVVAQCVIEGDEAVDSDTVMQMIEDMMKETAEGYVFSGMDRSVFMIFYGNKKHSFMYGAMTCCEQIQEKLFAQLRIHASVYLGSEQKGICRIAASYSDVKKVMGQRFLMQDSCFLYYGDDCNEEALGENLVDMTKWRERIMLAVRAHLDIEIEKNIHELVHIMRELCLDRNRIILLFQNLILSVMEIVELPGMDNDELYHEEYRLLASLGECEYLHEAEKKMILFCIRISDTLDSNRDSTAKKQAAMAMEYIEKNYTQKELSLQMICDYLSISISYFSSIFKEYYHETFVEALTRVRIDHAKQLFDMTCMKTYEVADAVGYSDAHYFSAVFKRATGLTPTEYMKGIHA